MLFCLVNFLYLISVDPVIMVSLASECLMSAIHSGCNLGDECSFCPE